MMRLNRGQAFAAHAAAVVQRGLAAFARIAGKKPVLPFAAHFLWLILAFHKLIRLPSGGKTGTCEDSHETAHVKTTKTRLFLGEGESLSLPCGKNRLQRSPMSRLRGRSQNRESQESCPEGAGAAFQRQHFGAAKAHPRLMGLLLALVTLLVYLPVTRDGFVVFDDSTYVTENQVVQNGLTWAGIQWAFTTGHGGNWHPLTWLSHMTDCELFGLNAGAHHSVNALFHAANAVLLLLLLFRLTVELWPATFIAALFAWHPLHVESVAWISERKDVLSTCFALLSLLAYARFAQKQPRVEGRGSRATPALDSRPWTLDYALALVFFALGLMAKPMLVTLPFVMLLLDYWPLRRISDFGFQISNSGGKPSTLLRLTLEKWPFFLLTAVSCVVTYLAQSHGEAVMTLQQFPLNLRAANALISYEQYLVKMIWPWPLAVFYPLPNHLSWIRAMAATAAAVLGVLSWLVWRTRRPCPYLLAGWLWFLGTLVPVIGLVQVGGAAMADRYSYFPLVGLFIAVAFGARDLAGRFQLPKIAAATAAAAVLAACLVLTENQLRYWHDSKSLFAHAIAVTSDNVNAYIDYGVALEQEEGLYAKALVQYREAARLDPDNAMARFNIGNLLDKMGKPEEALPELFKAVQLDPKPAHAHNVLGGVLLKQGRDAEAIEEFRKALRIEPDNFQTLAYTAHVLASEENPEVRDGKAALVLALKANILTGGSQPLVLDVLGMAFAEAGRFDEAQQSVRQAIDLATAAKMKKLEPLQQRLELYKNHQPWRESFRATNAPPTP
jgi:tetratricopeptide (TPR) repeat protein